MHILILPVFKINPSFKNIVSALKELRLEDNLLTHLPDNLDCLVNLKVLTLMDNPMEEPPIDVCTKGKEAIFTYLKKERDMKIKSTKVKSAKTLHNKFTFCFVSVKHIDCPMGLLFTHLYLVFLASRGSYLLLYPQG